MMLKKKYYTGLQIHEAIDGVVVDYQKAIEIYRRLAKTETDDVQPVKHGKWGMSRSEYGNIALIKCSECHFEYPMLLAHMFRYCPNCGAKMERSEDGET